MKQVIIENPVINSPYKDPCRHFRFSEDGITDEIIEGRRPSSYFVPIPKPKKKGKGVASDTEWTEDRVKENEFVNQVRDRALSRCLVSPWPTTQSPARSQPTATCG